MKSFFHILMIAGGLWIVAIGWQEHRIAQVARPEPLDISLADLQQRDASGVAQVTENAHVRFGPCLALYQNTMYSYRKSLIYGGDGGPSTALKDVFVPIVPVDDPMVEVLADPMSPQSRRGLKLSHMKYKVLLKTDRLERIGDIPREERQLNKVQGLIVNDVRPLKSDEEQLIELNFRHLKPAQIIIVEEGRRPLSMPLVWGLFGAGGCVFLIGAWNFFRR